MPKFSIEHAHALPQAEVKKRLDSMNAMLSQKYGIDAKWKSDTEATFKRMGASGTIQCQPGKVVVQVDLSMVLGGLKDQVQSRIQSELAKSLA